MTPRSLIVVRWVASPWRRGRAAAPAVLAAAAALLAVRAAWPAPAHAADLFPVDDWLGAGIKKAGEVALGPIKLGAEEIAKLLATIVGAIADLLIPKSLISAGMDGIRWLVSMPAVGAAATPAADGGSVLSVRMPHVVELRQTLTWIGVTLLPVGLVLAGGRAILAPSVSGDGPAEILIRVVVAGLALVSYDLVWAQLTRLCRLITNGLLGLSWVDTGVERMLETLLIGGTAGTAVAAEFVIPLLIMFAGGALLALLLLRVGLEVATALLYVLGGLVLGLSPTEFGRRLLIGWLFAATAIVVLPVLWTVVFVTGAALMLDAGSGPGGGFGKFVAQLFNVAAAAAVFGIAIKLGFGVFAKAQGSIAALGATTAPTSSPGMPRPASGGPAGPLPAGVPASVAAFSQNLRRGVRATGRTATGAAVFPVRHPVAAAQGAAHAVRHPVQATQTAASGLGRALRDNYQANGSRPTNHTAPHRPGTTGATTGADAGRAAARGSEGPRSSGAPRATGASAATAAAAAPGRRSAKRKARHVGAGAVSGSTVPFVMAAMRHVSGESPSSGARDGLPPVTRPRPAPPRPTTAPGARRKPRPTTKKRGGPR